VKIAKTLRVPPIFSKALQEVCFPVTEPIIFPPTTYPAPPVDGLELCIQLTLLSIIREFAHFDHLTIENAPLVAARLGASPSLVSILTRGLGVGPSCDGEPNCESRPVPGLFRRNAWNCWRTPPSPNLPPQNPLTQVSEVFPFQTSKPVFHNEQFFGSIITPVLYRQRFPPCRWPFFHTDSSRHGLFYIC